MKQLSTLVSIVAASAVSLSAQVQAPQHYLTEPGEGLSLDRVPAVRTTPAKVSTHSGPVAPEAIRLMRAASGVNICGNLLYADPAADGKTARERGLWSFTPDNQFTLVTSKVTADAYGATFMGGNYYCSSMFEILGIKLPIYAVYDSGADWDDITWGVDYAQHSVSLTTDGAMLYGCFLSDDGKTYVFGKMNPDNWVRIKLADLTTEWNACAMDADGMIYAIDTKGNFLKADPSTGEVTTVGATGLVPKYVTDATIDPATGRMFWTVNNDTDGGVLAEVDKTTGKATILCHFPNNEEITGLYIPYDNPSAPSPALNLKADFPKGALSGNVSFAIPGHLNNGTTATGNVTYTLKRDGGKIASGQGAYGATVTVPVTLEAGGYTTFAVELANDAGRSEVARLSYYAGYDIPAAPGNVNAAWADGKFTVTWEPVDSTVHGGYIDASAVTYDVVRLPDNVKVAAATRDTKVEVDFPESARYAVYSFEVTAISGGNVSKAAASNQVGIGGVTPPYGETFDTQDAFDEYILISHHARYTWQWYASGKYARYNYDFSNPADDWMITPGIKLQAGKAYRVSYSAYTPSYSSKTELMEVRVGTSPTAEGLSLSLTDTLEITDRAENTREHYFVPGTDGVYFIGFHVVSPKGGGYLYLDNVAVSAPMEAGVPDAATGIAIAPDPDGARKARVEFKMPSLSLAGIALEGDVTVTVIRGEDTIRTIKGAPGEVKSFDDETPKSDEYVYTFVPSNNLGEGKSVSVTKLVGMDWAKPITDVSIEEVAHGVVKIDWVNPTEDNSGHSLEGRYYTQIRLWDGDTNPWVDRHVEGDTYTFTAKDASERQQYVEYLLYPTTDRGGKGPAYTSMIPVGTPQKLPLYDPLSNGGMEYDMHSESCGKSTANWSNKKDGGIAGVNAQNDDNGYLALKTYTNGAAARINTIKLDFRDTEKPQLSFYTMSLPGKTGTEVNPNTIEVKAREWNDTTWTTLGGGEVLALCGGTTGEWKEVKTDLSSLNGKIAVLAIEGTILDSNIPIVVDNIAVTDGGGTKSYDLSVDYISVPFYAQRDSVIDVKVGLTNRGGATASGYTVDLYLNDSATPVATAQGPSVSRSQTEVLDFNLTFGILGEQRNMLKAVVRWDKDQKASNNEAQVSVVVPALEGAPSDLRVSGDGQNATLTWDAATLPAVADYIVYRDGIKVATVKAPALSYDDDDLARGEYIYCVTAANEAGVETWRTNLASFMSSGIDAILSGEVSVNVVDHSIVVDGAAGRAVTVAAVNGISYYKTTGVSGSVKVEVTPGYYIVTVGDASVKVLVK